MTRRLLFFATIASLLSPATARAELFEFVLYGRPGFNAFIPSNLSAYTVTFRGTFEIADAALVPHAFVRFRDSGFRAFDLTIQAPTAPYNFNLGNPDDKFPGDPYPFNRVTVSDPVQGLLFDANRQPIRFEVPGYSTTNRSAIRKFGSPQGTLILWDDDDFVVYALADGSLVFANNLRGRTPVARFGGFWDFAASGSDRTRYSGIYLIRSLGGATPPAAPVNLSAQVSGLQVVLSWDQSAGATTYQLEAGTAPGQANAFNGDVGNSRLLQAQGPPGTYFARVRARNAAGASAPSNEVQFTLGSPTPGPCTPPLPPTGVTVEPSGAVVRIAWAVVTGATSYQLEAGTAPAATNAFTGNVGSGTGVEFPAAGVPSGTYFIRVRAYNGCGLSAPSREVSLTLP